MKYYLYSMIVFLFVNLTFAQNNYSSILLPENLKENANSIIRNQVIDITISSKKSISIKTQKIVTVLNSKGINNIDAREYYSKSERVVSIEATVYNAFGKELKKMKRKDFRDQSVADGFSVLTDDRYYALDYTPTEYPFTIVYESERESSNTAFIPSWMPIDDYFESVQKSEIKIKFPSDLGFKYKEYNFNERNIKKSETATTVSYIVENVIAERPEEYSPSMSKLFPVVKFGLNKFYLEGVEGNASTWEEYGNWTYNSLLKDTEELSEETQNKVKQLIGSETDPIKKAKIIYKFVQDKTRYVSIQLGIGGWKPMLAKDVDRLGYGDCKALTNYTRVLLKAVGVESYYTEIYGTTSKVDFEKDFVAIQGNHIVLALPNDNKMVFLECTSQTVPFTYQGTFTDDRYAFVVKPTGGEIIKTNEYSEKASSQISKGNYTIDANGNLSGNVVIKSKGIQYNDKYLLESASKEKIDEHYKDYFSWINNMKFEKINFNNNKETVEFTEDLKFNAMSYGNMSGTTMMFPLNVFNRNSTMPQRYRNRKNPFEISRGFYDEDEIEIKLPDGFVIEALAENLEIEEKFGKYKIEFFLKNPTTLIYKRSLQINKGSHDKIEYENYRNFREKIARADNSKIVLTKKI